MKNSENITAKKQIKVKAYTTKDLSVLYHTDKRTLRRWLTPYENEIGKRIGNIYTPKQVELIFQKLGVPRQNQVVLFPNEDTQHNITGKTEKEIVVEENVAEYVDAAWNFAHAILWSEKRFSEEEIASVRKFLLEYFTFPSKNKEKVSLEKRLSVLCQRILITRSYLDFMPDYRFVPNPAVWFDRKFKYGFSGTSKWLKKVQEGRKINPQYREELEVLSKLYHEYMRSKSLSVSNKAAEYLLERSYPSLIRIFCPAISEIHAKQNYSHAA